MQVSWRQTPDEQSQELHVHLHGQNLTIIQSKHEGENDSQDIIMCTQKLYEHGIYLNWKMYWCKVKGLHPHADMHVKNPMAPRWAWGTKTAHNARVS